MVTVTFTSPVPSGAVAVMLVDELTTTPEAGVLPNITIAPVEKYVPVMPTEFPPTCKPWAGLSPVTVTGDTFVKRSLGLDALTPPGPNTCTVTVPFPAGAIAVIFVDELTVKLVAATPPNSTEVAPVKSVPVMTTEVPPEFKPLDGLRPVTDGVVAGAKPSASANWIRADSYA